MMQIVKYLFFQSEGESTSFKPGPAAIMMLLLGLFQGCVIYILISAWFS